MNSEQRALILNKFANRLDESISLQSTQRIDLQINEMDLNEDNLPKLDIVQDLMHYHSDITKTIEDTYHEVRDVMIHMRQLKNRKKNVQILIDSMTAIVQIKRLSYGLGNEPKQVQTNVQTYYAMKNKVYHMDKYIERIEKQISEREKQYQAIFDTQMNKNNSTNIAQISKVLQIIRAHTKPTDTPNTLQQISNFCMSIAEKQFKQIQESLFAIPIIGSNESNYLFFDMAKISMKVIATLCNNSKSNVIKVSGQDGLIFILKNLFQYVTNGIIFELLMRLKKYYEIDKITINQSKFVLKQRDFKQLQPYIKEFIAIWNQLERLRIHLLAEVSDQCVNKNQLKKSLETILNNVQLVQMNANIIIFMQAIMRFKFDKLLKTSRFVGCLCSLDQDFFKQINSKNLVHNSHVQDFLEETMSKISEGVEKALETLNTLIISAIINFTNHNLIYEDVFYAFNELFSRSFNKMPSNDYKVHHAVLLTLNAVAAFPKALKMLMHIKLPDQIPEKRIKSELEEVVFNNQQRSQKVLENLIQKIVGAQWFRFQLSKDYQKNLQKWLELEGQSFHLFVQAVCKVHAEIILQTQFSKKYTHSSAINFEKEIRSIISFYQRYSHKILPHFKTILDYTQVLQLQNEEDFNDVLQRFHQVYREEDLKRVWVLRS